MPYGYIWTHSCMEKESSISASSPYHLCQVSFSHQLSPLVPLWLRSRFRSIFIPASFLAPIQSFITVIIMMKTGGSQSLIQLLSRLSF